jgi:hypothetical protein
MIYACGTNAIYKHDEQALQVIDEPMKGYDYQKEPKRNVTPLIHVLDF